MSLSFLCFGLKTNGLDLRACVGIPSYMSMIYGTHTCENLDKPRINSIIETRASPDDVTLTMLLLHENHRKQNTRLLNQNICERLR